MIKLSTKNPDKTPADLLVYFSAESVKKIPDLQSKEVKKYLKQAWNAGDFTGKTDESFLFYPSQSSTAENEINARRVLIVGTGSLPEEKNGQLEQIRIAGGTAVSQARKLKVRRMSVVLPDFTELSPGEVAECLAEGLIMGNYQFIKYKKNVPEEEQPVQVDTFTLFSAGLNERHSRRGMKQGYIAATAANIARDMANEPGNGWTPTDFSRYSKKLAKSQGLKCTVLEKADMKKMGMGGILGVNQGSATPPKLVILEYRAGENKPTLLFVGKGLTFDSGGINLKPSAGMEDMKYDMCGGAAVLAAMEGVAEEKPNTSTL